MSRFHDLNLVVPVLRLFVWLVLLTVIFVPFERLFALHPQKIFRKAILTDVAYYFLSSLIPAFLLGAPLALVTWLVRHTIPEAFTSAVTAWPTSLQILAAVVVGEIGFYWGHRWSHEIPLLWRFHAIHHSSLSAERQTTGALRNQRAPAQPLPRAIGLALPDLEGHDSLATGGRRQHDGTFRAAVACTNRLSADV